MGKARTGKKRPSAGKSDSPRASEGGPWLATRPWTTALIVLGFAFLVNGNVLSNGLGWDDEHIVPIISSTKGISAHSRIGSAASTAKSNAPYFRPVVGLSYRMDRLLWGERPFGFHLTVLIAHAVNTALVFFLVWLLTAPVRAPFTYLPLLTAGLFAVHPAHAEGVAWISGRNDVLCTTFVLVSFILYVSFRKRHHPAFFAGAMLSLGLALLTKEMAVGLVFIFPVYEWLAWRGRTAPAAPSGDSPAESGLHRRWSVPLIVSAVPLVLFGLYFWMRVAAVTKPLGGMSVQSRVDFVRLLSSADAALGLYLKILAFPFPHMPFISAVPESPAALGLSIIGTLLLVGIFLGAAFRRSLLPGLGAAWTGLLIVPALPIAMFKIASTPAAERYTYGPSVGFLMTACWGVMAGLDRAGRRWPALGGWIWNGAAVAAMAFLLFFSVASRERNTVWKDPTSFWESAVAVPPADARPKSIAHLKLGLAYRQHGRIKEAVAQYQTSLDIRPDYALANNNLGNAYQELGDFDSAVRQFKKAIELQPGNYMPYYNLGHALGRLGRHDEAVAAYRGSIERNPNFPRTYNNLGNELGDSKRLAEAVVEYQKALALNPDYVRARFNLGVTLIELGRLEEAADQFKAAIRLQPGYAKAYYNLGVVDFRKKNYEGARKNYEKASALDPKLEEAKKALKMLPPRAAP